MRSKIIRVDSAALTTHDKPVQEEEDDGADHAADEAGGLPELIPAHGLTEPGRDERADNPQDRRPG